VSRLCRLLGACAIVVYLVAAFTPLPNRLAAAARIPAELQPADAIVVLGGAVSADRALTDSSLRRAIHGIRLYRQELSPLLVLCGTRTNGVSEAAVRVDLARELGVPSTAILTVRTARTTREEAEQSAALLIPRGVRRILLVTDPLHMERARAVFVQNGFDVHPAPTVQVLTAGSGEGRLGIARDLTEEFLGRLLYRVNARP
jgi:uncharacterized SAM-binding protein YcdF (DUF218 family)